MIQLDDPATFKEKDPTQFAQGIKDFPDQLSVAWLSMSEFALPAHYLKSQHTVILAPPYHAFAAETVETLSFLSGAVPVIFAGEALPAFVSTQSLVCALDYTGKSSELLRSFERAHQRGARLVAASSGGGLAALTRKYRVPHYAIHYGASPWTVNGYATLALLGVLARLSFLELRSWDTLPQAFESIPAFTAQLDPHVPVDENRAKRLAEAWANTLPVILVSETLTSVGVDWQRSLGAIAHTEVLVDALETVAHTEFIQTLKNTGVRHVMCIASEQEAQSVREVRRLLETNEIGVSELALKPDTAQLGVLLAGHIQGLYTSYYLSILGGKDPALVGSRSQG